jgi:hypothetical protein
MVYSNRIEIPYLFHNLNEKKMAKEAGAKENPWMLKPPPLSSEYTMYKNVKYGKEMEQLGLAELTHETKENKMRAR